MGVEYIEQRRESKKIVGVSAWGVERRLQRAVCVWVVINCWGRCVVVRV